MAHIPRSLQRQALACLLAVGVTFTAVACGSDNAKEESAAEKTTTTGTAVVTTTTTPMPDIDDPAIKAYCVEVRNLVAEKVTDQKTLLDRIEPEAPAELKDEISTMRSALADPGDSNKAAAAGTAFAQIAQYNARVCGVPLAF